MLRIVTVPEEDRDFRELVRSVMSEIRQQDGLASFEPDPRTWYVYRDGSRRPLDGETPTF